MTHEPEIAAERKAGWHPRNRFGGRYDFAALVRRCPDLARHVVAGPTDEDTVDFADPAAVLSLNRALLLHHHGLDHWDIPPGYLCPPVPGRAEHLHRIADLLSGDAAGPVPRGAKVSVLDIGTGANGIYPILGVAEFGWRFVATDIDPVAVRWAAELVAANRGLSGKIECRLQPDPGSVFDGVVRPGERFDLSVCNPPFHASAEEAASGTLRKLRNLGGGRPQVPVLNFGGRGGELWCPGGELEFIRRMVAESARRPGLCRWFTTLVSKQQNVATVRSALDAARIAGSQVIEIGVGHKRSRIVAWTFQPDEALRVAGRSVDAGVSGPARAGNAPAPRARPPGP